MQEEVVQFGFPRRRRFENVLSQLNFVMPGAEQEADSQGTGVPFRSVECIAYCDEVLKAFAHLQALDTEVASMKPVVDPRSWFAVLGPVCCRLSELSQ